MISSFQKVLVLFLLLLVILLVCGCSEEDKTDTPVVPTIPGPSIAEIEGINIRAGSFLVYDSIGRQVAVPTQVSSVVCSGDGCLRLITMLKAEDRIVGVDESETILSDQDAIDYTLVYPGYSGLPAITDSSGTIDPERIKLLQPLPDIILIMDNDQGFSPDELWKQTGIPVIVIRPGNLFEKQDEFEYSVRLLGIVLNIRDRAEAVIQFFKTLKGNLNDRIAALTVDSTRTAYVGGTSEGHVRDILDTTPGYMPFQLAGVRQLPMSLATGNVTQSIVHISLPELVAEQPDAVFIDLATMQNDDNAVTELQTYPTYTRITAVSDGSVYGLLPCKLHGYNYGSIIANAYYVGKTLYPDKFSDVNPELMADDIFTFLYGKPLFNRLDQSLSGYAFHKIPLT